MRRPQGYAQILDPASAVREYDTVTCGHCGRIVFTKPGTASTVYLLPTGTPDRFREEPGAGCHACMRPVCLPCYDRGTCLPLERQLAAAERTAVWGVPVR